MLRGSCVADPGAVDAWCACCGVGGRGSVVLCCALSSPAALCSALHPETPTQLSIVGVFLLRTNFLFHVTAESLISHLSHLCLAIFLHHHRVFLFIHLDFV